MIILRHCESEFNRLYNLSGRDPCVPDPALSAHGQDHAYALVDELRHKNITRILVSPFTRTLQTATPIARALGLTPQITPLVRERGMYSCDVAPPPPHSCRTGRSLILPTCRKNGGLPYQNPTVRSACGRSSSVSRCARTPRMSTHWLFPTGGSCLN